MSKFCLVARGVAVTKERTAVKAREKKPYVVVGSIVGGESLRYFLLRWIREEAI